MKIPRWARSIRFRLAGLYTLVVFGLAVLVVGSIYFAFSRTLEGKPVSGDLQVRRVTSDRGVAIYLDEGGVEQLELLANQRALEKLRTMSLIALAVLFPASLGTGWVVAGRVLRPVGRITQVARDIEASDLSRRIDLEGPNDELKRLADTFDGMLGRIEGGVEDQRRFIQDISHELRNPLATMATSIDVALSDPHADARSLRETVKVVRRSVDRLTRSVADLTRFARRELPDSVTRAVRLGALAREVIEEFRVPAEARGVHLQHVGGTGPTVRADRSALRSAVGNLANNAVRLAPTGSTVSCGAGSADGWAWVGVRDQGPGIPEAEHTLVFQRAWGRDQTHMHREKRAGLGLSIVRQVAEANGGTVTLASAVPDGSSFVIWLPLEDGADPAALTNDGIHPIRDPLSA
ncbi:MAG: HAMP domain-containing histidine kinase [Acidimicrobiia bacterium]|jgi:signal transduction histidine kinase|nr:HAMP domain-containing histidine kinase [Acidimicrobiia bacterium]